MLRLRIAHTTCGSTSERKILPTHCACLLSIQTYYIYFWFGGKAARVFFPSTKLPDCSTPKTCQNQFTLICYNIRKFEKILKTFVSRCIARHTQTNCRHCLYLFTCKIQQWWRETVATPIWEIWYVFHIWNVFGRCLLNSCVCDWVCVWVCVILTEKAHQIFCYIHAFRLSSSDVVAVAAFQFPWHVARSKIYATTDLYIYISLFLYALK